MYFDNTYSDIGKIIYKNGLAYAKLEYMLMGDRGGLTRIWLNYVFRKTNKSVLKSVGIPIFFAVFRVSMLHKKSWNTNRIYEIACFID